MGEFFKAALETIQGGMGALGGFLTGSVFPMVKQIAVWAFTAAMKHNYAMAITDLIPLVLFLLAIGPYVKFLRWGFVSEEGNRYSRFYHSEGLGVTACVIGVVLFFALVCGIVGLYSAIPRLVAPEWSTTKDIIEIITPLVQHPAAK